MAIRKQLYLDVKTSFAGASLYILKPGGSVTGSSVEILASTVESVQFSSIGALTENSYCYYYDGGLLFDQTLTVEIVSTPVYDSDHNIWSADVFNSSPFKITLDPNGRLILREVISNNLAITRDNVFYSGDPLVQPTNCPANGRIRVYIDEYEEVDIILDSSGPSVSCITSCRTICPTVRPEDFGAVGDGITDDRASIQEAIDYLADRGGGTVELGSKIYAVGRSSTTYPGPWGQVWYYCLWLRSGVMILGQRASSMLRIAADAGEAILLLGSDIDHCQIRDVWFDGDIINCGNLDIRQGVYLLASQYCEISSCMFSGFGRKEVSTGIALMIGILESNQQDSTCNIINMNSIIDSNEYLNFGIRLWSDHKQNMEPSQYTRLCRNNIVSNNLMEGTRWATLQLSGPAVRANTVSENVLKNIKSLRGVLADKGASGNLFVSNTVDGLIQDQAITTAAFCEQGDIPQGQDVYPVRYSEDNTWTDNTVVNLVQTNVETGVYGFYCNRSHRVTIRGLRVSNVVYPTGSTTIAGIMVESEYSDATIDNCTISDIPVGIALVGSGIMQNVNIGQCNILANYRAIWIHHDMSYAKYGICIANSSITINACGDVCIFVADGNRVVIMGNIIKGKAVLVDAVYVGECIFQGNAVSVDNAYVTSGVDIQNGSLVCVGNVISTTAGYGIHLSSATANGIVSCNHLLNNPSGGCNNLGVSNLVINNIS